IVFVDDARGHGQMLPFALGVGEAEVDPVDLLVLDARKNRARVVRHGECPALFAVSARTNAHGPAVNRVTRRRFELGSSDSPPAPQSQRGSEYFTGALAP